MSYILLLLFFFPTEVDLCITLPMAIRPFPSFCPLAEFLVKIGPTYFVYEQVTAPLICKREGNLSGGQFFLKMWLGRNFEPTLNAAGGLFIISVGTKPCSENSPQVPLLSYIKIQSF
jgi:hypothetical protein